MADQNKLYLGTNKDTYIAADEAGNIVFQHEAGSRAVVDTEGIKFAAQGAELAAIGGGSSGPNFEYSFSVTGSGEAQSIDMQSAYNDFFGARGYGGVAKFIMTIKSDSLGPQWFQSSNVFVTVDGLQFNDPAEAPSQTFSGNASYWEYFFPLEGQSVVANVGALESEPGDGGFGPYTVTLIAYFQ